MKKPGGILAMILAGKKPGKGGGEEEPEGDDEAEETGDDADELFGDAFDALQDGDKKGFVRAMKAACRCL